MHEAERFRFGTKPALRPFVGVNGEGIMLERPEDVRRQAECATMLVAIAKVMLNAEPAEFAAWLRAVADDIEATRCADDTEAACEPEPLRRKN